MVYIVARNVLKKGQNIPKKSLVSSEWERNGIIQLCRFLKDLNFDGRMEAGLPD
jgi:hypothetical protein